MCSGAVWLLLVVVVVDCATAGRLLPWPVPRDFWRVCNLLVIGCAARVLAGCSRRGAIGRADDRIALATACGFLVRGAINLLIDLTG
jgi:hypothetical protein